MAGGIRGHRRPGLWAHDLLRILDSRQVKEPSIGAVSLAWGALESGAQMGRSASVWCPRLSVACRALRGCRVAGEGVLGAEVQHRSPAVVPHCDVQGPRSPFLVAPLSASGLWGRRGPWLPDRRRTVRLCPRPGPLGPRPSVVDGYPLSCRSLARPLARSTRWRISASRARSAARRLPSSTRCPS